MSTKKQSKRSIYQLLRNPEVATLTSLIAVILSGWVYIDSIQPKNTKLTINTDYRRCFSGGVECSQLFIYSNDEAPCFDLRINFDANQYKDVIYLKDFEKTSLLYSENTSDGGFSIPAMHPKPLKQNNSPDQGWIGFIPNKIPLYIAFIPYDPLQKNTVTLECSNYKKEIELKSKNE